MTDPPARSASPRSASAAQRRLESWKEIAGYFTRDVRTVQRWETTEGLPVHRHMHRRRGSVFAYESELDAWWQDRHADIERQEAASADVIGRTRGVFRPLVRRLVWLGAAAILVVIAVVIVEWPARTTERSASPIRFEVAPPRDAVTINPRSVAISPDGRKLAFAATLRGRRTVIHVRPLDDLDARVLEGTDGANDVFWSPDSRSLGFISNGRLWRVDASGGRVLAICGAPMAFGGSWNREGRILFVPKAGEPVQVVSAAGGVLSPVVTIDPAQGDAWHLHPRWLPDGRHFIYQVSSTNPTRRGVHLASIDSSIPTRVLDAEGPTEYVAPGYLLHLDDDGTVKAQSFDYRTPLQTGGAVTLATGVSWFSASATGVVAYASEGHRSRLTWFTRSGTELETISEAAQWSDPDLSPDENRVAVSRSAVGRSSIWIFDLSRGGSSLLRVGGSAMFPVWLGDSDRIAFRSNGRGSWNIYETSVVQSDRAAELVVASGRNNPVSVTRDGAFLAFNKSGEPTGRDLWIVPLRGDGVPKPFANGPFNEYQAQFSRDGRWIAYASDESGRYEIYVQPFPPTGDRWPISTNGGYQPRWRGDGHELYYVQPDRMLMAVTMSAKGQRLVIGRPEPLFSLQVRDVEETRTDYDVTADGARFLVNRLVDAAERPGITVLANWQALAAR